MADSEASLDQQPDLKKRARRRLVGAAALALLAAIVLPMVMDHEPRPASQDIQVRIPAQDGAPGIASRIVPARPSATPLPPATPAVDAKAAEKVADNPASKAADKPAGKETARTEAKPADPPSAEPKTAEPKIAEAAATAGGTAEQWVVQLGAYKEAGNVKLLLSKLKGMGVIAYTEKYDSPQGPRTRVRAGPFPSKEAAEKARAKAKIIGVDGPVAPK